MYIFESGAAHVLWKNVLYFFYYIYIVTCVQTLPLYRLHIKGVPINYILLYFHYKSVPYISNMECNIKERFI